MLRKRSRPAPTAPRTTSCQQAPMADNGPHPSPPAGKQRGGPTTSLFPSPKLSTRSITVKEVCDTETIITSPTSILDTKPFSHLKSSFWSELNTPRILDSKPIGLAIVDALKDEKLEPNMCASHFKIQIPKTPCDFGTKTRSSQLDLVSPTLYHSSAKLKAIAKPPGIFSRVISASEMELSEDYTCVISHGPNPKTTHIFDDCIVESCCGGFLELSDHGGKERGFDLGDDQFRFPCESFLSFCQTCKKSLGDGEDIYMYRGEKAFCSAECRQHEIMLEEGMAKTGI